MTFAEFLLRYVSNWNAAGTCSPAMWVALVRKWQQRFLDVGGRRIMVEVQVGGVQEIVVVTPSEEGVILVDSHGRREGPFIRAASKIIGVDNVDEFRDQTETTENTRESVIPEAAAGDLDNEELDGVLEDIVATIARVGIAQASDSASIDEAFDRVRARTDISPELERWVGRLERALGDQDTPHVARLLDGALGAIGARRDEDIEHAGLHLWFGRGEVRPAKFTQIHDQSLVEIARESLTGFRRMGLEARYLLSPLSGNIYRELRRSAEQATAGSCPRHIRVGLGEVDGGGVPSGIKLRQYTVSPNILPSMWNQLRRRVHRDIGKLTEHYRVQVSRQPGMAEPFTLFSPERVDTSSEMVRFVDHSGAELCLSNDEHPGLVEKLRSLNWSKRPSWVAGRMIDDEGELNLVPLALFGDDGDSHLRLT